MAIARNTHPFDSINQEVLEFFFRRYCITGTEWLDSNVVGLENLSLTLGGEFPTPFPSPRGGCVVIARREGEAVRLQRFRTRVF